MFSAVVAISLTTHDGFCKWPNQNAFHLFLSLKFGNLSFVYNNDLGQAK
jgi:hypothetical protein